MGIVVSRSYDSREEVSRVESQQRMYSISAQVALENQNEDPHYQAHATSCASLANVLCPARLSSMSDKGRAAQLQSGLATNQTKESHLEASRWPQELHRIMSRTMRPAGGIKLVSMGRTPQQNCVKRYSLQHRKANNKQVEYCVSPCPLLLLSHKALSEHIAGASAVCLAYSRNI